MELINQNQSVFIEEDLEKCDDVDDDVISDFVED